MKTPSLKLSVLPSTYAICRLLPTAPLPTWPSACHFFNIVWTPEELSIVCETKSAPKGSKIDRGWKCIRVKGAMDLGLIGIMASLAVPLAEAKISIFTMATYDTDYFMVRTTQLAKAKRTLTNAGHKFVR